MKIIGGSNKGRYLKVPRRGTRPTRGIVRQAIFNVLGDAVLRARVLDVFAGSGSLGIEALSRGAHSCVFIEKNPDALRSNIRALDLPKNKVTLLYLDFRFGLKKLAGTEFDLIFIDPPYGKDYVAKTLALVTRHSLLHSAGVVIAEHPPSEKLAVPGLMIIKEKKYGDTVISFLTKESK